VPERPADQVVGVLDPTGARLPGRLILERLRRDERRGRRSARIFSTLLSRSGAPGSITAVKSWGPPVTRSRIETWLSSTRSDPGLIAVFPN
jgi:hypothetical protein